MRFNRQDMIDASEILRRSTYTEPINNVGVWLLIMATESRILVNKPIVPQPII